MRAYARPPVDCNSPQVRHPVTGKIDCIRYPECCGQQNVPIDTGIAMGLILIFIGCTLYAWYLRHKNKQIKKRI